MPTPRRHHTPVVHPELEDPPQMLIVDPGRIRSHREARRISLRKVAQLVGCSHTQVANYESGRTPNIPEERARMLSLLLDLPMASVFRPIEGFVVPENFTTHLSAEQLAGLT